VQNSLLEKVKDLSQDGSCNEGKKERKDIPGIGITIWVAIMVPMKHQHRGKRLMLN